MRMDWLEDIRLFRRFVWRSHRLSNCGPWLGTRLHRPRFAFTSGGATQTNDWVVAGGLGASMSETKDQAWRELLANAARNRNVFGWEKIEHYYHAMIVLIAIQAFGDDPRATFFME